jgi:hypothetical protein
MPVKAVIEDHDLQTIDEPVVRIQFASSRGRTLAHAVEIEIRRLMAQSQDDEADDFLFRKLAGDGNAQVTPFSGQLAFRKTGTNLDVFTLAFQDAAIHSYSEHDIGGEVVQQFVLRTTHATFTPSNGPGITIDVLAQ